QMEVHPRATRPVLLMPLEALLEADGHRGTAFVLSNGRAERREVTIAFLAGDRVAISAGLDSTAQVITDGAAYLQDGQRVATGAGR
ncbi:MAG: efflux RND transporter periplasmic adaptor subunit, partial [Myxococcota bacterium]